MENSSVNHYSYGFDKYSMRRMMESLGLSSFDVHKSSSNNVMVCEFKNFSRECTKHITSIPFFEIFDIRSRSEYTHFIDNKPIKRDFNSSGLSLYTNQLEYGLEIRSGHSINCDLLGINPVFFNNWLGGYQISKLLPDYLKGIQDEDIQQLANHIAFLCKKLPFRLNPSVIDEQIIELLKLIAEKYLCLPNESHFSKQQRQDIVEYIDDKVKKNEAINLEILIDQFAVEYRVYWIDTFKSAFKTTPYQYYMARKLDILSKLRDKESDRAGMLICNQRKLFALIHELVENSRSLSSLDSQNSQEKTLIAFLLEYLGYKSEGTFKNHCSKLRIKPVDYYNFLRIEKAKQLLITSTKDIAEISYECGFNDVGHFRWHFSNRVNKMSPEEFRETYKQTRIYF